MPEATVTLTESELSEILTAAYDAGWFAGVKHEVDYRAQRTTKNLHIDNTMKRAFSAKA